MNFLGTSCQLLSPACKPLITKRFIWAVENTCDPSAPAYTRCRQLPLALCTKLSTSFWPLKKSLKNRSLDEKLMYYIKCAKAPDLRWFAWQPACMLTRERPAKYSSPCRRQNLSPANLFGADDLTYSQNWHCAQQQRCSNRRFLFHDFVFPRP
jgi:hypothetical protein